MKNVHAVAQRAISDSTEPLQPHGPAMTLAAAEQILHIVEVLPASMEKTKFLEFKDCAKICSTLLEKHKILQEAMGDGQDEPEEQMTEKICVFGSMGPYSIIEERG